MSGIGRNAAANLGGQGVVALLQVLLIPVYVRFVGVEAWGLFGFYATVQAFAQLLDLGMSAAVNRQLARDSVRPADPAGVHDFVRTIERLYAGIGVAIGLVLLLAAPTIAVSWLRVQSLPTGTVVLALRLIALLTAVQWPLTLYQGALLGLDRHVAANVVRVGASVVSAAGALALLAWVAPSVVLFFAWQAVVAVAQVAVLARLVRRSLPAATRGPRFAMASLAGVRRFAYGMAALTATATLLTQLDRVVLSRLVPLEQFGYYTLGAVAGQGLSTLVAAVFATMFPLFARLSASGDDTALRVQYVRLWAGMAALVVPIAGVVGLFGREVMEAWTGNATTARLAAPVAALMSAGAALNGFASVAYALQLARGETGLALRINVLLCALAVPGLLLAVPARGIIGAAMVWPAINLVYAVVAAVATGRCIPVAKPSSWMARSVILPSGVGLLVAGVLRLGLPAASTRFGQVLQLGFVWTVVLGAMCLSSGAVRADVVSLVRRLTGRREAAFGVPDNDPYEGPS